MFCVVWKKINKFFNNLTALGNAMGFILIEILVQGTFFPKYSTDLSLYLISF